MSISASLLPVPEDESAQPLDVAGEAAFGFPPSFAQQRIWLLEQIEGSGSAYNESCGVRLQGPVAPDVLERCLNEIVRRHEALRTTFVAVEGEPLQVVAPELKLALQVIDLRAVPSSEREAAAATAAREEVSKPFDLGSGPLLRASVLLLDDAESIFFFTAHHIAIDGWSMAVLLRELSQLYAAFAAGRPSPLPELPIQYVDFAIWQREWLQGPMLAEQSAYWKERLEGAPTILRLPIDRPRPAMQTFRGAQQALALPDDLVAGLRILCRRHGVTLYMVLLAAFQVLLLRHTGDEDVIVGSPIAGRGRVETEALIGFFLNTLVLRTDLSGDPTFRELLGRVREVALGAYAHQDLPFELLVEQLAPVRDLSVPPLVQAMFVLQPDPRSALTLPGVTAAPYTIDHGTAKLDLTLAILENDQGLDGWFEYSTDLFDTATIARLAEHFQILLAGIVADCERRLSELPLLGEAERHQLLVEWNDTALEYAPNVCIQHQFEAQAERTPEAVAVVFEDRYLTYRELNARANQLAHHLRTLGVGPEVLVGVCLQRSLEMIVALLGILKAGGAYLPLDPNYPGERLAFMLADSGAQVVLSERALVARLPDHSGTTVLLDAERDVIAQHPSLDLSSNSAGENLAYVIYTSGSTGKPKGVMVTHRNVANLFAAMDAILGSEPPGVWLALTSISFDISVFELFWTLSRGCQTVIGARAGAGSPLAEQIARHGITHMQCTPSLAESLTLDPESLRALRSLRTLFLTGEALPAPLAKLIGEGTSVAMFNLYGPTETTVWSTAQRVDEFGTIIPIGRPLANTQAFILDRQLNPTPLGVAGELYIGGDGVTRGYFNRPGLTEERFIPDPFARQANARLYRTGDIVRYRTDGTIEYHGRADHQVKIRGFRIELGEIEAMLRQHPAVEQAIVVARDYSAFDKRLVGYVVPRRATSPSSDALRGWLHERLPDYLVPSAILVVSSLPLTPSGKVNRRALPAPDCQIPESARDIVAPATETEAKLARIWQTLLGIQSVGVRDNFFEFGGHSLLAVRLFAQIESEFGTKLPLVSFFQRPTIEHLGDLIDSRTAEAPWPILVPLQRGRSLPPLFCVNPIGGDVIGYTRLLPYLGPEWPVYGLRARGMDGLEEPETTVEQMGATYAEAIRRIQPSGPYCLMGHSFGGHLAYELACQLTEAGSEVGLVIIIDQCADMNAYGTVEFSWLWLRRFLLNLPAALRFWLQDLPLRYKLRSIIKTLHILRQTLRPKSRAPSTTEAEQQTEATIDEIASWISGDRALLPAHQRRVIAAQIQAGRKNRPRRYAGRVTLFHARKQPPLCSHDPTMGWGELAAGGVEIYQVPGGHHTVLNEPHVGDLARQLRECLARAHAANPAVRHEWEDI